MSAGRTSTDMFSFDRKPRASFPASNVEPYFPYADAWEEFEKLKKRASDRGPFGLVRSVIDANLFTAGVFGWHNLSRRYGLPILLASALLLALELSYDPEREEEIHSLALPALP